MLEPPDADKLCEARAETFNDLVEKFRFLIHMEGLSVDNFSILMGRGAKFCEQKFIQQTHFRLCDITDIATTLGYKVEINLIEEEEDARE